MANGLNESTQITLSARTWLGLIAIVSTSTAAVVWGYSRIEARVTKLEYRYDADASERQSFREELLAALRTRS